MARRCLLIICLRYQFLPKVIYVGREKRVCKKKKKNGQEFNKFRDWLKNAKLQSEKWKLLIHNPCWYEIKHIIIMSHLSTSFINKICFSGNGHLCLLITDRWKTQVTFWREHPLNNAVDCSKYLNHTTLHYTEVNVWRSPGRHLCCGLTTQTSDPLISLFNKELVLRQYNSLMPFSYFSVH